MIHQKEIGQVGHTISHYMILEKLGEGGMGKESRVRFVIGLVKECKDVQLRTGLYTQIFYG